MSSTDDSNVDAYIRSVEIDYDDESCLDIEQLCECDTGGVVWDAALVLISYMRTLALKQDCEVAYDHVLDLGSGTGVVGLALYKLGLVQSVMLTDMNCQLDLIRRNIRRNFPDNVDKIQVARLCWDDEEDIAAALEASRIAPLSLITVSDCVYGDKSSSPLACLLLKLLRANPSAMVFLSFEKRERHRSEAAQGLDYSAEFFSQLRQNDGSTQCVVECIPPEQHGEISADEISLYRITLRSS